MVEKECLKICFSMVIEGTNSSENYKNQLFQNLNNLSKDLQKTKEHLPPKNG